MENIPSLCSCLLTAKVQRILTQFNLNKSENLQKHGNDNVIHYLPEENHVIRPT